MRAVTSARVGYGTADGYVSHLFTFYRRNVSKARRVNAINSAQAFVFAFRNGKMLGDGDDYVLACPVLRASVFFTNTHT